MQIQSSVTPNFDLRNYYLFIKMTQNDYEGELNLTHVELSNGINSCPIDIDSVLGMKVDENEYTLMCKFDDESPELIHSTGALNNIADLIHSPSATAQIDLTADVESLAIDSTLRNIVDIQLHSIIDESFSKPVIQVLD